MTSRRVHSRSVSLPVPAPLRPSELAQLNLPPVPQEDDFDDERWTRFSSKVGRLAGRGDNDSWGWTGTTQPASSSLTAQTLTRHIPLERRSTAPAMTSTQRQRRTSRSEDDETTYSTSPLNSASSSSRSSVSSMGSSPRVHFLEPLAPTEDDDTDSLIRRLLASHDTTGWCSLVERALEFPIPQTRGAKDASGRDRWDPKMVKSLAGLADKIERGDLGRCRSDPLLSTMVLVHDDETEMCDRHVDKDDRRGDGGSWWKLGDLMALL